MPQARFKPIRKRHVYDETANLKLGVLERIMERAFGDGNMDAWFDSLIQVNESNSTEIINAINMVPGGMSDVNVNVLSWPDPLEIVQFEDPVEVPSGTLWYWQDASLRSGGESDIPVRPDGWWFALPPEPPIDVISQLQEFDSPYTNNTLNGVPRSFTYYLDVFTQNASYRTLPGPSYFVGGDILREQMWSAVRGYEHWSVHDGWKFVRSAHFRVGSDWSFHIYLETKDNFHRNAYFAHSWASLVDSDDVYYNSTHVFHFFVPANGFTIRHVSSIVSSLEPAVASGATHRLYFSRFIRTPDRLRLSETSPPSDGTGSLLIPAFTVEQVQTPYYGIDL